MSDEPKQLNDLGTENLLRIFLGLKGGEVFRFLLPAGDSVAVMQRVRVTLSRKRMIARRNQVRIKEFRLKSEVTPHESDPDMEVVSVWRQRTTTNKLTEIFDDLALENSK